MAKLKHVRKRDGRLVPFDESKIADAIFKAAQAVGGEDRLLAEELASVVTLFLEKDFSDERSENLPTIEEIQDMVEKVLIETGHAKTAKAYILYRDKRAKAREALRVRKEVRQNVLFDDMVPMVDAGTREEVSAWSKRKIITALEKEADISPNIANEIAAEVERKVFISGIERISTSLIRALVDNELFERGFGAKLQEQTLIGMPKYDLDQLIFADNESLCQTAIGPSHINLAIAKNTLKQYALREIFSRDVADAHLHGVIHIHALDQPAHLHRCCASLECLKRYAFSLNSPGSELGWRHSPQQVNGSSAAQVAQILIDQAVSLSVYWSRYCIGYTGIDHLNISIAPYVVECTANEMRAIAKRIVPISYSSGQEDKPIAQKTENGEWLSRTNMDDRQYLTSFVSVCGRNSRFPMLNIYTDVPAFMANLPAIGSHGQDTGSTYSDYADTALRFADALIDAFLDAKISTASAVDARRSGLSCMPDVMPKLWVHCTEKTFDGSSALPSGLSQLDILKRACKLVGEGIPVGFVMDRDDVSMFASPPLRIPIQDSYMIFNPESMRFFSLQNVTLNLSQVAYRARTRRRGGFQQIPMTGHSESASGAASRNIKVLSDIEAIYPEIDKAIELAIKAHVEKRMFLGRLMLPNRALFEVTKDAPDGKPFVDLNKAVCLISLVGLNECLQYLTGRELHEGDEILKLCLRLVSYIYFKVKEEGKRQGLRVFLDDLAGICPWLPDSSSEGDAAARLAQIDARNFPEIKKVLKLNPHSYGGLQEGSSESETLRYTNGFHLRCFCPACSAHINTSDHAEASSPNLPIDTLDRMHSEGRFHAMVESGTAVIVLSNKELSDLCSDGNPMYEGIFEIVKRTLLETQVSQLVVLTP